MAKSHYQVAYEWATKRRPEGKGSRMFYEGPFLYSYGHHFPLGKHHTLDDGSPVVLLNPAYYSSSTRKHQSIARNAVCRMDYHQVEKDLWHTITDRASLAHALAVQHERDIEAAEADRQRKRESAKRRRAEKWEAIMSFLTRKCGIPEENLPPFKYQVKALADLINGSGCCYSPYYVPSPAAEAVAALSKEQLADLEFVESFIESHRNLVS